MYFLLLICCCSYSVFSRTAASLHAAATISGGDSSAVLTECGCICSYLGPPRRRLGAVWAGPVPLKQPLQPAVPPHPPAPLHYLYQPVHLPLDGRPLGNLTWACTAARPLGRPRRRHRRRASAANSPRCAPGAAASCRHRTRRRRRTPRRGARPAPPGGGRRIVGEGEGVGVGCECELS